MWSNESYLEKYMVNIMSSGKVVYFVMSLMWELSVEMFEKLLVGL